MTLNPTPQSMDMIMRMITARLRLKASLSILMPRGMNRQFFGLPGWTVRMKSRRWSRC